MNYLIMGQLIDPKEYRDESLVSGAMTSHGMGGVATRTKRQFVHNLRTKPKMYREVGQGSGARGGGTTPLYCYRAPPPRTCTTAPPPQHP